MLEKIYVKKGSYKNKQVNHVVGVYIKSASSSVDPGQKMRASVLISAQINESDFEELIKTVFINWKIL